MRPKISVIVPCYNVEQYLDRCMSSILNQTLKNIEIIMIDDGSPDRCPKMCDNYSKLDHRVKVIHKKNGGLGYARNSGIEIAKGEYLAFVDSDDFIELDMYEKLYSEAIKNDADIIFSNCKFYKKGVSEVRYDVYHDEKFVGDEVKQFLLDYIAPLPEYNHDVKYMMSVWHAIYRSSVVCNHSIRFMSERNVVSEDILFNIDVLMQSNCVLYLKDALYNYCLNPQSLAQNISILKNDKFYFLYECIENRIKFLKDFNYKLHLQRFIIFSLRNILITDYKYCINKNIEWKSQIKRRLNSAFYVQVLTEYPINKMPFKFRLFYSLIRSKNIFLLRIMFAFYK